MTRILVLIALTVIAVGVAWALQRRRPDAPSAPSYRAPRQLDRDDFDVPADLDLVVVFASSTCDSCPLAWATVTGIERSGTGAQRVLVQENPELHKRYKIDGVPTTLVVDRDGVVHASFFGPVEAESIIDALDSLSSE
ncbi:MAG: thioredoxin family protein [Acidimicrobiales bacterium]